MQVTIITDASHDPRTKACGWAWWLRSNRGAFRGQGHECEPIFNSSVAETLAVFRSLSEACKQGLIDPADQILIRTDCIASIRAIQGRRLFIRDDEEAFAEGVHTLREALSLQLRLRHIKGHTTGNTHGTSINNECDRLARIEMAKARKILGAQPGWANLGPDQSPAQIEQEIC